MTDDKLMRQTINSGDQKHAPQIPAYRMSKQEKIMKERINEIIHESLGLGGTPLDIRPENTLMHDMGADSLDIIELSMELEQEFTTVITVDDCGKWRTIADVHAFIECRAH